MRNVSLAVGLFALMFVSVVTGARAEGISIAADPNSPDMKVEVNLRDADIVEVLTALFNSTGGKYVVEIGKGVVGRIARLQLPQTPFEEALNAVLGSEFSYTKQQEGDGIYRYRISGSAGTSPSPTTPLGGPALLAPPTTTGGAKSGTKPGSSAASAASLFGAGSLGGSTGGAASSDEKTVTKLIMVSNLDLERLCEELGGSSVFLFTQTSMGDGSSGSTGGSGYGSSSSRSSGSSSGSSNRQSRSSSSSRNSGSSNSTNY